LLFVVLTLAYFAAGYYLSMSANVIYGDAWSRVELAERVLFSRDPHLAAVGFVWNPLPVVALLPIVALRSLWPALTAVGLASGLVSALCMAGGVMQLRGMFDDARLPRRASLPLVAAFALHPLIVYFGANGMSEAMLLFFLLATVRYLARWLRDSDLNSLVVAGTALGLAYFTRYEAAVAAAGVISTVAIAAFMRARSKPHPLSRALCDTIIVGAPFAVAFVFWAVASWIITGHPIERFASIYDNRTAIPSIYASWSAELIRLLAGQYLALEPGFLVLLAILLVVVKRRAFNGLSIAAVVCLGPVLMFMTVAELSNSITHELRYIIVLVPFVVILAGATAVAGQRATRPRSRRLTTATKLSIGATLLALPAAGFAMLDATLDPYGGIPLQSIFSTRPDGAVGGRLNWSTARAVAQDLDRRQLGEGKVLVDDFLGFPIVVTSTNPRQFVITSDRDFKAVLADPKGTGAEYILVPQPGYFGNLDAVNRTYPTLFDAGAGMASLVEEFPAKGLNDTTWRLYRLT
jgi:hypothetical protein